MIAATYMAGILTAVLASAFYEAHYDKTIELKQKAIIAFALWGALLLFIALLNLWNLTLDMATLTINTKCIRCNMENGNEAITAVLHLLFRSTS